MIKKRIKSKKKKYIKYEILTSDLFELICYGYSELDGNEINKDIDLKDKKLVKEIWYMHKPEVMRIWRSDPKGNAGHRPKFWWIAESTEPKLRISFRKYKKLTGYKPLRKHKGIPDPKCQETDRAYLKRLKLLEDWEIEEFKRIEKVFGKGSIYLRDWELI